MQAQPFQALFQTLAHLRSILVVDDNAANRIILEETLSAWGALVQTAENGKQCLDAVKTAEENNTPFQLILLDGNMPIMDGFETAKNIKLNFNHLEQTAMLLTSDNSSAKIKKVKNIGIPVYMLKPVKQAELKKIVQLAMGQQMAHTAKSEDVIDEAESKRLKELNILLVEDAKENQIDQENDSIQCPDIGYFENCPGIRHEFHE